MSKFMRLPLCAAALCLCASAPAFAGPFASASYANSNMGYSDTGRGNGYALSAGYQIEEVPVFFEAEYFSSGKMEYEFIGDGSGAEFDGFKGYVGYALGHSESGWLYLKGGFYSLDGKIAGISSEKQTGLSLGVGFDWMFAKSVGLRLEIDTPFKVNPTPGIDLDEDTQLTSLKIGLVWRLPSAAPAPAYVSSPASQPAPVAQPSESRPLPPPVRQPMPAPRPVPAPIAPAAVPAAMAPAAAPSASRSYLRQQPAHVSAAVREINASSVLTLQKSIDNAEGKWWYAVTPDGARGWVADTDLSK